MHKVASQQSLEGFLRVILFGFMILIGALTMTAWWILGTFVAIMVTGLAKEFPPLQTGLALSLAAVAALTAIFWLFNLSLEKLKGKPWGSELRRTAKTVGLRVGVVVGIGLAVGAGFVSVFYDDFRWAICGGQCSFMMSKGDWDGAADKLGQLQSISSNSQRRHVASFLRVYSLDRASRFDEAEREGRQSIKELESEHNADKIELADAYVVLANTYGDANKRNQAEELFVKTIDTINASKKENHTNTKLRFFGVYWPDTLKLPSANWTQLKLLKFYTDDGKLKEAQSIYEDASKDPELLKDKDAVAKLNQLHAELLAKNSKPAVSGFDSAADFAHQPAGKTLTTKTGETP